MSEDIYCFHHDHDCCKAIHKAISKYNIVTWVISCWIFSCRIKSAPTLPLLQKWEKRIQLLVTGIASELQLRYEMQCLWHQFPPYDFLTCINDYVDYLLESSNWTDLLFVFKFSSFKCISKLKYSNNSMKVTYKSTAAIWKLYNNSGLFRPIVIKLSNSAWCHAAKNCENQIHTWAIIFKSSIES